MTARRIPTRRTLLGLGACLALGASSLLTACGSSGSTEDSAAKADESTTSTTAAPRQIRGDR